MGITGVFGEGIEPCLRAIVRCSWNVDGLWIPKYRSHVLFCRHADRDLGDLVFRDEMAPCPTALQRQKHDEKKLT